MTRIEALAQLRRYRPQTKIRILYDKYEEFPEVCISALPSFEYPDWDYRTVGELLKQASRLDAKLSIDAKFEILRAALA